METLKSANLAPRFPVLGYSGGAGYAAACPMHLPDRVTAAAIVACVCHDRLSQ
jgi:poly(3-hydroxybutyrate) depolymerase